MPTWKYLLVRTSILGAALIIPLALQAAEKIDLKRTTPIPADQPIPIADFFRPLVLQEPKLNPSGTHIAAIVTASEDRHQVLVYDLKSQKIEMAGGSGDKDVYEVYWLNDNRIMLSLGAKKMYGLGLIAANIGDLDTSYALVQYYGSSVVAIPPKNRLRPLIWNRHDSLEHGRDLGVAEVNSNINSGKLTSLGGASGDYSAAMDARDNNERHIDARYPQPGGGIAYHYLADRDGKLFLSFTSEAGKPTMHRLEGTQWLKCPVNLDEVDLISSADQPNEILVVGPRQEGKPRALQTMNVVTGQLGDVLLQDPAYDFDGWVYRNPATQDIMGAIFQRNGPRVTWFNEDYRKLQEILDGFFPKMVVRIIGSDEAQKLFLVRTFSDRQPAIYSWVDLEKRTAGLIKSSAPWIDPQRMQPINIVNFKTRDGRKLDAYLTMPAGASKKNPAPLVVLPHGGPWARDSWGFDGEAQFLASRGYAVLKPNYRGSTGYDWMFPEEDRWNFLKMHDDVTDATKAMIASGLVDRDRIGIMGGSFGGYLAISGVVNEPSLYRCAVTIAGVFDWEQQIKDKKYNQYDSPAFGWMINKLGDPKKQPEKFDAISPGRRTEKIRVPVFVSGGTDDHTVEIEQSRTLISALKKNGVPHETLIVREEGHGMGHVKNQVELYGRIEAFLDKNLKPMKTAVTAKAAP